jgi:hypothetical protein
MSLDNIPAELREVPGWVVWRKGKPKPGGKFDKIPYYVTGEVRSGEQGSEADRARSRRSMRRAPRTSAADTTGSASRCWRSSA